jgi:hypothetical protein
VLGAVLDHCYRDTGLIGSARAGRDEDSVIVTGCRCLDLIVANDGALRPKLGKVLHQVEDEGVVVIDDKDAGHMAILL